MTATGTSETSPREPASLSPLRGSKRSCGGHPSGDQAIEGSEHFRTTRVISETATVIGQGMPLIRRPGGLPLIRAGQVEGALGVAGATDEQDVECALAGIDAFTSSGTP